MTVYWLKFLRIRVDFQPKLDEFEGRRLTARTKVVIVNTPNNPTGVVYSEETIVKNGCHYGEKNRKNSEQDIYPVSDELYREFRHDNGVKRSVSLTKYYANTIVGYSYSKSLSLPVERIGYLVIPYEAADSEKSDQCGECGDCILGFVNAPNAAAENREGVSQRKNGTFLIMTETEKLCIKD